MSKNESLFVVYLIIDETHFPFIFSLTGFIYFINLPFIVLPAFPQLVVFSYRSIETIHAFEILTPLLSSYVVNISP